MPWRRAWQPTPVFLPRNPQGQRSLMGYSPRGCKESDMTERLNNNKPETAYPIAAALARDAHDWLLHPSFLGVNSWTHSSSCAPGFSIASAARLWLPSFWTLCLGISSSDCSPVFWILTCLMWEHPTQLSQLGGYWIALSSAFLLGRNLDIGNWLDKRTLFENWQLAFSCSFIKKPSVFHRMVWFYCQAVGTGLSSSCIYVFKIVRKMFWRSALKLLSNIWITWRLC